MTNIEEYLKQYYKGNREQSLKVMEYFNTQYNGFEKNMKFIHIAGTNGKGSCTEILSNILIKQGYKVGKFLTPHLIKYNERISINGKQISDKEMIDLIEELNPKIEEYNKKEKINISVFELITMIGLLYFYRNKVDFVILETGLGGRFDATNIISKPLVSIISSIGYDHVDILGRTLIEIASQKAGIIKPESNTVIFEQPHKILKVFEDECNEKKNELHIVRKNDISNYSYNKQMQKFNYKDLEDLSINLKGKIQIQNASICLEAIKILQNKGFEISIESIKQGLKTIVHKGRMEEVSTNPTIIYDGAHNEPAIRNLQEMIKMYYSKNKRVYIISILKRKDYEEMLRLLAKDKEAIFVVTSGNDSKRYATSQELYEKAVKYKEKIIIKNLEDAIEDAMKSDIDTVNLIVGSLYTYETVINKIKEIKNAET